jgi:hypothetical protein
MVLTWPIAFALTQAIEVPCWLWAMRVDGGPERGVRRVEAAFAASLLTHPMVWYVFPQLRPWPTVAISEAFAWGVEAWWMHRLGVRRAATWSLVVNGLSFGIGLLL